ncbi:phenylacetate--CoA ligase family protein [Verrucomicrobiota bacterium]
MHEREGQKLQRLRRLIADVAGRNEFYSRRLRRANVTPELCSLSEFCERMPFTHKGELAADQRETPPYGRNLTYPLEEYTRFSQTSSTSGTPLVWLDTHESWSWMLGNWRRVLEGSGVTAADRVYFAFSFGPFIGFWTGFEAAVHMGCLCIPGGTPSSSSRLLSMIAARATVLCCTPTYALRLAEVASGEGIDLSEASVRRIIVAGEPGGSQDNVRSRISKMWNGAEVFDHYGMTEVGAAAYQDAEQPGMLRMVDEEFIVEVIDPESGREAELGEIGEIVLTPLGRAASPVIRYRTGDLVRPVMTDRPGGPRRLGLAGGIIGRTDEVVVVRGVNVYPSAVLDIVHGLPDVVEHKATLSESRSCTELELEVELRAGADAEKVTRQLETKLRAALALRIPVRVAPPGLLPRSEMKANRWPRVR